MVSEAGQPAVHRPPSHRPRDHVGPQNRLVELPEQQTDDVRRTRAHGFAHPDFLGPLFGGVGGQAEQTQRGDNEGDTGAEADGAALQHDVGVHPLQGLIQEPASRPAMAGGPPGLVDRRQGLGQGRPPQAHHEQVHIVGLGHEHQGLDRHAGVEGEVGRDPDDLRGGDVVHLRGRAGPVQALPPQHLAHCGGWRGEAQASGRGLVQHHGAGAIRACRAQGVAAPAGREEAAGQWLEAVELQAAKVDGRSVEHDLPPAGDLGRGGCPVIAEGFRAGAGHGFDAGERCDLLTEGPSTGVGAGSRPEAEAIAGATDEQDPRAVDSQPVVQGKQGLPPERDGGDGQADHDGELERDQTLAGQVAGRALNRRSLQHRCGPEGRQDERGIGSGQ